MFKILVIMTSQDSMTSQIIEFESKGAAEMADVELRRANIGYGRYIYTIKLY